MITQTITPNKLDSIFLAIRLRRSYYPIQWKKKEAPGRVSESTPDDYTPASPLHILQQRFGFSSFRLNQEAIIQSVLQKKDTFVLMPTGGGKSLCYQIPALIFNGLTIVISPLIALMKDQVDALRINGIEAAFLNSTQSSQEQEKILEKVRSKSLKLLYLAPESSFFKQISSFEVSLIAIDEAHCISHWGHDFRPEYRTLAQLKRSLPQVPVIALTATADRITQKDIIEKLELNAPVTFVSSFNRANIRYTVEPKQDSFVKLLAFLEKRKDESGIVYCLSRASTETVANQLAEKGYQALPYHAGIDKELRTKHQEMFLRDEVKIIVATIAFGMGIDKSNVRYVVHMDLPKNIESYYQETGRAGRDGLDNEGLLFYSYGDVAKMKRFVQIDNNPEQTEIYLKKLDQMARYGDLITCRRKYLLNYFDEATTDYCGNCDVCLTRLEAFDGTVLAQKVLSAISRLNERFGAGYVIDFLRGSQSAKIADHHKELKTFGTGSDVSKDTWNEVIRGLLAQQYLFKTEGQYPLLKLTEKSEAILKGGEPVTLTKVKEKVEKKATGAPYETELFAQLKETRKALAGKENVPAYIILSDATLQELATYLPQTLHELSKISGFGDVKLTKYGDVFLNVVTTYCQQQQLSSRAHLKAPKRERKERLERDNDTKKQTLDLFKLGHSIQKIADLRNLSPGTVEAHLAFYIQQGRINLHELMEPARVKKVQQAIEKVGGQVLTPIKEVLGDEYSFGEIRMVMANLSNTDLTPPRKFVDQQDATGM